MATTATTPRLDYTEMMNAHRQDVDGRLPDAGENDRELLILLAKELTPAQRRKVATELEASRVAFSRTSDAGHLFWYPRKLALCERFQTLT